MEDYARGMWTHLGRVSLNAPLISNLSVLHNITLIKEFHYRQSRREAEGLVLHCLDWMNLRAIADKKTAALTGTERFCAMVLRAVMLENKAVAIDQPFKIIPELQGSRFIRQVLASVKDLLHECRIFDYIWNQDRYQEEWP